jgi:glycosyltransferase involved in cell wall biosynthesis
LRRAAAAFAPDLVHDNGLWLPHNHRIAELACGLGWPRVVSTRGMLEPWALRHKHWKKAAAWRLYQRRDVERAAALHATADAEAVNIAAMGLKPPVHTIPNGVDLPELAATDRPAGDQAPMTAVFLGRIYPVKGLQMLVEAWARARPAGWRLLIAGPDEAGHRREVEAAVAAAGLSDVVSFPGPVWGKAKTKLLLGADLFVLPSHSESFGMALAEALAHGAPALTTTAVPWPALEARQCGWRAAPAADALAAALRVATACDRQTLRAMGAAGRELIAAEYGWPQIAGAFVALYEALTGSRRQGRTRAASLQGAAP